MGQDWFWSKEWQEKEQEVQQDIDSGCVYLYENVDDVIVFLQELEDATR